MKDTKDQIDVYSYQETTRDRTRNLLGGGATKAGEERLGIFAILVLGSTMALAILQVANPESLVGLEPWPTRIIGIGLVYGTIAVPRLDRIDPVRRLIVMTLLTGTTFLFAGFIIGSSTVLAGALVLLFLETIVILSTEADVGPTGNSAMIPLKDQALYAGWFLGLVAVLMLL